VLYCHAVREVWTLGLDCAFQASYLFSNKVSFLFHFFGMIKATTCNCQKDSQKPTGTPCMYADKFTQTSWRRSSVSKMCHSFSGVTCCSSSPVLLCLLSHKLPLFKRYCAVREGGILPAMHPLHSFTTLLFKHLLQTFIIK